MRIGIDMMGGDHAPGSTIRGALLARQTLADNIELILVGDRDILSRYVDEHGLDISGISVIHTREVVEMDDHPLRVFKEKPSASMFLGLSMLKACELDGFCSVGNTGALMVGVMQIINSIPGVIRPAIGAPIPDISGNLSVLLDVGLNPDARPDVLYQYGIIGTIYSRLVNGFEDPKVALLNIGLEEEKGNMVSKATYQLMKGTRDFNFIGNMEANEFFVDCKAQVIVSDGFVGNMMLKQAETFYRIIKKEGITNKYLDMFNFEIYGGTPILGINEPVTVGHGVSGEKAIKNMLVHTAEVARAGLVNSIKEEFNK